MGKYRKILYEENNINMDYAELIIAADAMYEKFNSIVEDLGEWIIKTYFPFSDQVRKTVGENAYQKWMENTKEEINSAFESINRTKEVLLDKIEDFKRFLSGDETSFDEKASDEENEFKPEEELFLNDETNSEEKKEKIEKNINSIEENRRMNMHDFKDYTVTDLLEMKKKLLVKEPKTAEDYKKLFAIDYAINAKLIEEAENEEIEEIAEKWDVEGPVVDPEDVGKWKDYTVPQLCKLWKKLRKKKKKTPADREKIAQIVFAIRAKHYGARKHWGPAKPVCDIKD